MNTIKFFFKSLVQNICILKEEQKWWYAVTVLVMALVISVSGVLSSGLGANTNSVIYPSTSSGDTAIDRSLTLLANEINDTDDLTIVDGKLVATGKYNKYTGDNKLTSNAAENTIIEPNVTIKYSVQNSEGNVDTRTDITSLAVFVFPDLNPNYSSSDTTILNSFLKKSVYLYGKTSSEATSETAQWTPYSFIIFTQTSVHMSTYALVGTTKTSSAISSCVGDFKNFSGTYSIKSLFRNNDGTVLSTDNILSNFSGFLNQAYSSIKVTSTWTTVGIYFAINLAIVFLAGVVFYFLTRKRALADNLHFSFWQAQKVAYIEALTPAVLGALVSLLSAQYSVFVFLISVAMRTSFSISKLSAGGTSGKDDKPVYKARA